MKQAAAATLSSHPDRALSILVAEDVEVNRRLAEAFLTVGGHAVRFAGDGAEAVQMASESNFDLILMDIMMPVMDGLEATRRIRALPSPARAQVPIVAVTANSQQTVREACEAAGMDGFMAKPLTRNLLESVLSSIAAGRR
jgi:CheY-like chemotaxis protein